MVKEKYVTACPKCGSSNHHKENDISSIAGGTGIFVCNNCGYSSPFFPEVKIDRLKDFKSNIENKSNIEKKENKQKTSKKNVSVKIDSIIALVFGVIILIIFGIIPFLILFGIYFIIKFLFFRKK